MPTPNLKLLLNAMRLGQPQDPQAAVFALAEALMAQEEVVEELKRRLQVVQSAAQILEAKASRMEAELEALRRGGHVAGPPPSERPPPPSFGPPPMPHAREPMPHGRGGGRAASEAPPPPGMPAPGTPTPGMPMPAMPRAPRELHPLDAEDSQDDFRVETVVVNKRDVEILMGPEAPFRIAPAGQHVPARGSIPGAPWARGARQQLQPQPQQPQPQQPQQRQAPQPPQPPMHDEFTLDAHHDDRDEGDSDEDGETYADTNRRPPPRSPRR